MIYRRVSIGCAILAGSLLLVGGCKSESSPSAGSAAASPSPRTKDPEAARAAIAQGAIVIDVRTQEEYATDHLPTATNVPVQDLDARLGDVERLVGGDKSKTVVVYCAAGGRAAKAKAGLEAVGYTHVINGGGLDDLR